MWHPTRKRVLLIFVSPHAFLTNNALVPHAKRLYFALSILQLCTMVLKQYRAYFPPHVSSYQKHRDYFSSARFFVPKASWLFFLRTLFRAKNFVRIFPPHVSSCQKSPWYLLCVNSVCWQKYVNLPMSENWHEFWLNPALPCCLPSSSSSDYVDVHFCF